MKLTLRIAGLTLVVVALAATCTRANDRWQENGESLGPQPTEKEAGRECSTLREERSTQNSSQAEEKKKSGLLRSWLRMADKVKANQPDWLSPLATTSGRLKQEFRYDVFDQPSSLGNRAYQLGGNKGLEFIAGSRTQLLLGVPTYTLQSPKGPPGGFGDIPLQLKFRIASAERNEGNYLLTFVFGATASTGSHRYGLGDAVLMPALAFGKGWGRFDVQSTFGASVPAGDTSKLGRQLQWNTAFQYEAAWKLWPELEVNSTFFETGKNNGEKQVLLTPGLGFGRVRFGKRFRFSSAAGLQIAATRFHAYNHRWIFSERFSF